MRLAAHCVLLLGMLSACTSTAPAPVSDGFQRPNSLMAAEIDRRVEQIPYQHRDELFNNLMWLAQAGEQTIPTLLRGLQHEHPKVRSSSAWVLGRIGDRRTIPDLQAAARDREATVRLESARTLVLLGDLAAAPTLIEGLDSERKEVRYMCHEALKSTTGHDFGYDHLMEDQSHLRLAVLRWRQWWSDYTGDQQFAVNYQQRHGLQLQAAKPLGETKIQPRPMLENDESMPPVLEPGVPEGPAVAEPETELPAAKAAAEAPEAGPPMSNATEPEASAATPSPEAVSPVTAPAPRKTQQKAVTPPAPAPTSPAPTKVQHAQIELVPSAGGR